MEGSQVLSGLSVLRVRVSLLGFLSGKPRSRSVSGNEEQGESVARLTRLPGNGAVVISQGYIWNSGYKLTWRRLLFSHVTSRLCVVF